MHTLYNNFLYVVQQMSFAQICFWLQKKFSIGYSMAAPIVFSLSLW